MFLMGVGNLPRIVSELTPQGEKPENTGGGYSGGRRCLGRKPWSPLWSVLWPM